MKILICGGKTEADFVIRSFQSPHNKLVIMNDDPLTAKILSEQNGVDVLDTDPTKIYSFEIADVYGFDLVIALMESDADCYVCCKIAKEHFGIKKAICTVSDPDNVEIFKALGIDSPISGSYLLTQRIKGESDIESIIKTLTLENDKIVITEINVKKNLDCCGKSLMQLKLPDYANVTCIFRNPEVVIPHGNTIIQSGDTLVIASAPDDQKKLIKFIKKTTDEK
ncbi:MAG: TrkA family potassium uptake protein [Bacilli bacterium]|jgi:trk system potassium uptake protein TrkA|nr:TrkA family potassium uptake protein [Bacilli bacterium]